MSSPAMEKTVEHALDPHTMGNHLDRLFRAARAMCRSGEDAEDLVQETYVRVLTRPRLLRSDNDLAVLLGVLRNTFISGHRAADTSGGNEQVPNAEPLGWKECVPA
jgi:DNA-directed RNA polymerase specialized sigma24 family protein